MTTDEFLYSLKFHALITVCLRCTFLTEPEVNNKITFRNVHGLLLPGHLSSKLVS